MASKLTKNVLIRGTVYYFRRRVPKSVTDLFGQREFVRSLETSSAREARFRACLLFAETERAFSIMKRNDIVFEQAVAIVHRLKKEPLWDSPTQDWLFEQENQHGGTPPGLVESIVDATDGLSVEEKEHVYSHLRRMSDRMAVSVANAEVNVERQHGDISVMLAVIADAEKKIANWHLAREVQKSSALVGERDAYKAIASAPIQVAQPLPKPSPLFSAKIADFIAHKKKPGDDGKCYTNQTVKQVEGTFRLWTEIIGEQPVREYNREQVGEFRAQILRLPFSHGKSRTPVHALDAIRENQAREQPKPTLTMKTAKRHFSALQQFWKWLHTRGFVDDVIFSGFEFAGTKSNKNKTDDWSPDDLAKLFSYEPWYGAHAGRESAYYWLPLVALHTGMRLEEIARLRPGDDLVEIDGTPAIKIQPHPDGWNPKTEAGERVIPIHSALIKLGFLNLVERRKDCPRLFSDLEPGGPDGKYGYSFSRDFSKIKTALGVGKKTKFHSFRHSVETILQNVQADKFRGVWIDAVLGHEAGTTSYSDRRPSEGVITYLKRIGLYNVKAVVEAIVPPVDLSHLGPLPPFE